MLRNGKLMPEFEYRDIFGNLRTTFTDADQPPTAGIYPAPQISSIADYDMLGFEHYTNQNGKNNFRFQKQERIFDLDLDLDIFKYRVSDSKIGRFWQVDPLSEKYMYNSVYAFQENKFGLGVEFEGSEVIPFPLIPIILEGLVTMGEAVASTAVGGALILKMTEAAETPGAGQGVRDSSVPMWVQQRGEQMNKSESGGKQNENGKYSHLKEPKNVGDGKKTTTAQRGRILEENKKQNNGELKSDGDGRKLNMPKQNKKGEKADKNQAEVDHEKAKSKGGSNSNSNLRVISKEENQKKGNKDL